MLSRTRIGPAAEVVSKICTCGFPAAPNIRLSAVTAKQLTCYQKQMWILYQTIGMYREVVLEGGGAGTRYYIPKSDGMIVSGCCQENSWRFLLG